MMTDLLLLWLITFLTLGLAHWFQWPWHKPPHRLVAYVAGTLCLNVPLSIWLLSCGHDLRILLALWGNIAAGGAIVILGWGWDALLNNWRRRMVSEKWLDEDPDI